MRKLLRLFHTSDWHLGRSLYGRKRHEEFEAFLDWLAERIEQDAVDALLVAGDVFDTSTPGNPAQALYYRFLCRVAASSCRHLVIIAGNHDSPSFLNAPRELLKALDIHVIGNCSDEPADEVLLLRDAQGIVELIICAVPYLRDRDIRMVEAGESLEDKERKLIQGIRSHYARVAALAEQQRESLGADIPIIAMGHLFTSGGQTLDGDGVRELYVGSLAHVRADIFPKCLDYVALGHLHIPQEVGGSRTIRYSGSPIAMGFGEARQQKSLCQIDFQGRTPEVQLIEIPVFQRLERIKGDWNLISDHIQALSAQSTSCWLEVIYEGTEIIGDLRERLEALTAGSQLETLRIENRRLMDLVLHQAHAEETLKDLNELEVFERCLAAHEIAEDQRPELLGSYRETLRSLQEADLQAE